LSQAIVQHWGFNKRERVSFLSEDERCYIRLFYSRFSQNSRRQKLNILTKLKEIWPKLKQNFPKSTQNIQFFSEMVKVFLKKLEKGSKFRLKLKEICRKLKFTGVFVTRGEPKNRE